MPIIIDEQGSVSGAVNNTKKVTPKFFSNVLTGSGGKVGVLNYRTDPQHIKPSTYANTITQSYEKNFKSTSGDVTTHVINISPTHESIYQYTPVVIQPHDPNTDCTLEDTVDSTGVRTLRTIALEPQFLVVTEDASDPDNPTERSVQVRYRLEYNYHLIDPNGNPDLPIIANATNNDDNSASVSFNDITFTCNPVMSVENSSYLTASEIDKFKEWIKDYSLHEHIVNHAEIWEDDTAMTQIMEGIIDNVDLDLNREHLDAFIRQIQYLENYPIALETYRKIYASMKKGIKTPSILNKLSKYNQNILMNDTLNDLEAVIPQLITPPKSDPSLTAGFLSGQQRLAVSTDAPLVMVRAGAGTGKSSVIMERMDYLNKSGVDPQTIKVNSFTNAAADNITERNPGVDSKTNASMIHAIYQLNYPTHDLSTIPTIKNSLDIYYPNDDKVYKFRTLLSELEKNATGSYTKMNEFIENNFDFVIEILDHIRQTALELEIIICYQKIDTLIEPAGPPVQHLIVDETQDNSIFEFIFFLRYVTKHKANMFIVGDPSQTLYEFRNSNPKALNALESSKIFATYNLTTNYRSNQEILDFANVALDNIEANQYARIQLRANSLKTVTSQSFADAVRVDYQLVTNLRTVDKDIKTMVRGLRSWIDSRSAGEQIAFLAYKRRDVENAKKILEEMYPTKNIVSIVPAKTIDAQYISEFIVKYWNDVRQVQPTQAAGIAASHLVKNLHTLPSTKRVVDKIKPIVVKTMNDWYQESYPSIQGWINMHSQGLMTKDMFFENLRTSMINYEIRNNAIRQRLVSQKNNAQKEKNLQTKADIIVSTIHSAKGLEFDHTIVLYQESEKPMDEPTKRMFYVAFTRAMKSEVVIAFGKNPTPRIVADYEVVIDQLRKKEIADEKRAQSMLGGISHGTGISDTNDDSNEDESPGQDIDDASDNQDDPNDATPNA